MSLTVSDLTVAFGRRRPVVSGVDLTIEDGQRLGLIGESGSGKSVTALAVMGLLPEYARVTGSVQWDGLELVGLSDRRLARLRGRELSMVFQEPMTALDPTMRIGRQLREVTTLHDRHIAFDRSPDERVRSMLDDVGLPDPERILASFPHQLSGGQRQRVIMAMALVNAPDLVICDEPTTALDVTVQARVLRVLDRALERAGTSCLFISHDLAVVSQVCTDVAVMLHGEIVERGPVDRVFTHPEHPYTRGLVATSRLDLVTPGERLPVVSDFWRAR